MYAIPDISLNFNETTKELLIRLVHHRETVLEQLRANFGNIRQKPCFESFGKLSGFEILLQDSYINGDKKYDILLKFSTQKYGLQVKVVINQRIPLYTWLYWDKELSVRRSRKFIETVYVFLSNFHRIPSLKQGKSISSNDIRKYWDKLIDDIHQSI